MSISTYCFLFSFSISTFVIFLKNLTIFKSGFVDLLKTKTTSMNVQMISIFSLIIHINGKDSSHLEYFSIIFYSSVTGELIYEWKTQILTKDTIQFLRDTFSFSFLKAEQYCKRFVSSILELISVLKLIIINAKKQYKIKMPEYENWTLLCSTVKICFIMC